MPRGDVFDGDDCQLPVVRTILLELQLVSVWVNSDGRYQCPIGGGHVVYVGRVDCGWPSAMRFVQLPVGADPYFHGYLLCVSAGNRCLGRRLLLLRGHGISLLAASS